jgi:hypothetical protein
VQAIALSYPSYRTLLERCRPSSLEYRILMTGFPLDVSHGHPYRHIIIRCEFDEAQRLITLANRAYPRAAREIWNSLKFFR